MAIEKYYELNSNDSCEIKVNEIEVRTRSISNFFKNNTIPFEKGLNFIAFVFEVPLCTLADFLKNNETKK